MTVNWCAILKESLRTLRDFTRRFLLLSSLMISEQQVYIHPSVVHKGGLLHSEEDSRQASVHPDVRNIPFLSTLEQEYHCCLKNHLAIPVEQRPPLTHSDIRVFSGNSTTNNIKGVIHLSIELQHVKYKWVFHVSSDEVRGILGADFLERYDARVHFARRRVMLNNVAVNVYSSKGVQLNQKVVIEKPYDIPAGRRVRIQCKISGKKKTREDEPVMIEG